ncbi:MAG: hypothetical protein ACLR7K_15345 [Subdoligranulum sp.]
MTPSVPCRQIQTGCAAICWIWWNPLKVRKILTGTIQGVERLADNPEMSYAVIYHGDFKVIIPVLEAIEEPEGLSRAALGVMYSTICSIRDWVRRWTTLSRASTRKTM